MTRRRSVDEPVPTGSRTGGVAYVIAAGVLAVAVTVAVLVFGIERPPSIESLQDRASPTPGLGVAWRAWSGSSQCVHVAASDGGTTRPWCGEGGGELVGWVGSEVLLALYEGSGVLLIDVETGRASRRPSDDDAAGVGPGYDERQGAVTSYHDGGELVVEHGERELWRVATSQAYRVDRGWESPDGEWIAAVDSADRILLFSTTGEVDPRVWVGDADGVSTLVWEGEAPDDVD